MARKMTKSDRDYRIQRLEIMGPWYGRALVSAALAFPIGVFFYFFQDFAGTTTDLKIDAVVSVSVVGNLVMGGALWRAKVAGTTRSDELNRLRGRAEEMEVELGRVGKARDKGPGKR